MYGNLPPPQPRQLFHHNQQPYRAVPPPAGFYQNQQFNRAVPPPPLRPQFYPNQQLNRPNFYENQRFHRPNVYENQQFNRSNFIENQQFRPRPSPPKALNFRNWEYARPGPPPHCGKFASFFNVAFTPIWVHSTGGTIPRLDKRNVYVVG